MLDHDMVVVGIASPAQEILFVLHLALEALRR